MPRWNRKQKALLVGVLSVVTAIHTMFPLVVKKPVEPNKPSDVLNKELIKLINETQELIANQKDYYMAEYKDLEELMNLVNEAKNYIKSPDKEAVKNIYDKLKAAKDKAANFVSEQNILENLAQYAEITNTEKVPTDMANKLADEIKKAFEMTSGKNGEEIDLNDVKEQEEKLRAQMKEVEDFNTKRRDLENKFNDLKNSSLHPNDKYQSELYQAKNNAENKFADKESSLADLEKAINDYQKAIDNAKKNDALLREENSKADDIKQKVNDNAYLPKELKDNYTEKVNNILTPGLDPQADNDKIQEVIDSLKEFEDYITKRNELEDQFRPKQNEVVGYENQKYKEELEQARQEALDKFNKPDTSIEDLKKALDDLNKAFDNSYKNSDLLRETKDLAEKASAKIENSKLSDRNKEKNKEVLEDLIKSAQADDVDNTKLKEIVDALNNFEPKEYYTEVQEEAMDTEKVADTILDAYDTSKFPDIDKAKKELDEVLNNPNATEEEIEKATEKVKEKVTEFVNDFNENVSNTTSNFYNGWEGLDLYNNQKANSGEENSSFIQSDLMGWDNQGIKDEIADIASKYFDNKSQQSTLHSDNAEDFNKAVDESYKIDITDWSDPKIPGVTQKEVEDKYLSVIYETTRVLRKHLLKSLNDGAKFISASRGVIPNNIWLQMMHKTFGYYALDGESPDQDNLSLQSINETPLEEYTEENGWVIPDSDKTLFSPNLDYVPTYDELFPVYVTAEQAYWTLYPYFQYAQLYNKILNPSNVNIESDPNEDGNYLQFVEKEDNASDKDVYSEDVELQNFLSPEAYEAYLKNKDNWFNSVTKNDKTNSTVAEQNGIKFEFSFDIFKYFSGIPWTSEQVDEIAEHNISSLNAKYFNEAVSIFNDTYQKEVENVRNQLEAKKLELEKDSENNAETLEKINNLLAAPKYSDLKQPLMDKYSYFKDQFIEPAKEILE
ncbi:hypothetical protein FJO69_02120 [[Mycoplasma] falconis]|uniref:Uncharacterized protein n=1 Tax=[Mycoplasma] falconis TaxID=92403 RepID=A0A501X9T3_9BACT|nr:hypothetical protein [[Mycoplasma] falconis]TPE57282.1 hypothetical protein FJO69_02120 [[Mycoplasma] falconis]